MITGASGFVGGAVVKGLIEAGTFCVRAAVRRNIGGELLCQDFAVVGEINRYTNWKDALESVDVVVHCAARVHVMSVGAAEFFLMRLIFTEPWSWLGRLPFQGLVALFLLVQ
ncbi:NAD-dependent epimerase/dehydratase family protein [Metapseudomonas otitidis]|uniref:NAD-dependent epimerase/dehydratase family protein n=1 Tax=Metapseudomonas otitidis TaxID=319939 RepID=UPI00283AAD09|nr:NAD-dependent epimerase/dehydratase family protein [Pseudomonas otitidis]